MPAKPVVVIHGWSDRYTSFKRIGRFLSEGLDRPVTTIDLADYQSMDDEVGFDDLRSAMDRAWDEVGLPRDRRSVDVVVHSTGGLVIRDWMTHVFTPTTNPVHHLLMLAPANFGSPLAHKGKAWLGRVVKGWRNEKRFQTGARILAGLELASPFSWDLALRDRFGRSAWYGPDTCLATVLVGNTGYSGLAGAVNENGSDGTVRVSTASLEPVLVRADFATNPDDPTFTLVRPRGRTAFCVVAGDNHSTIAFKDRGPKNAACRDLVLEALTVTDGGFGAFADRLDDITSAVMADGADEAETHGYQNSVFHVADDHGADVADYFLEFFVDDDDRGIFSGLFQRDAIRGVHCYGGNTSYRSVYVDCTVLHRDIDKPDEGMRVSLHAEPQIAENKNVGYRPLVADGRGFRISKGRIARVFRENRTALVDVTLRREQGPKVFRFRPLG